MEELGKQCIPKSAMGFFFNAAEITASVASKPARKVVRLVKPYLLRNLSFVFLASALSLWEDSLEGLFEAFDFIPAEPARP